jgi:hypothetical protein
MQTNYIPDKISESILPAHEDWISIFFIIEFKILPCVNG